MNWWKRLRCLCARAPRPPKWPTGVPELTVEEMHLSKERGLQLRLKHPAFAYLADDLGALFAEAGAVNYVEYTVYSERYGLLTVCIQRADGETPATMNTRLLKRIAELETATPREG